MHFTSQQDGIFCVIDHQLCQILIELLKNNTSTKLGIYEVVCTITDRLARTATTDI